MDASELKKTKRPSSLKELGRFADRLKEVIGESSVRGFSSKCGLSDAVLRSYLREDTFPTLDRLELIADAGQVRASWLATGEGPMRPGEAKVQDAQTDGNLDQDEYSLVPRYNVEVSAGHGAWPDREQVVEKMAFRRSWLQRLGLRVDSLVLVTARGDSMEPTFHDGDLLLVDLDQKQIIDGGISVIRSEETLLAKRMQVGFGDQVIVRSDNQIYHPLEISKDKLNIVGRVVWRGGKM